MTSNQIANAANVISTRVINETQRHNVEVEKLENRKLDLQEQYQQLQYSYESEKNAIQRDYNEWYKSYMNSTGREKDEAKTRLDEAQTQLSLVEAKYAAALKEQEILLKGADIRLKDANTAYTSFMQGIEDRKATVAEKNALFNAYNIDNTIRLGFAQYNLDNYIKRSQIGLEAQKIRNNFTLEQSKVNIAAQNYSLNREQFNYFQEYNNRLVDNTIKTGRNQRALNTLDFFMPSLGEWGTFFRGVSPLTR